MDLITYHQHWHQLLLKRAPDSIKALYPNLKPHEEDEAGLYYRFVQGHFTDSVTNMCSKFFQCLKFPNWTSLTEAVLLESFYKNFPPRAYELRTMALDFPSILEGYVHAGELPLYLSELAQLEVTQYKVYIHSADEKEILSSLPNETIALGPTLHFLQIEHNTLELFELLDEPLEEGFVPEQPIPGPQIVLLSRDLITRYCQITSPSTLALTILNILIDQDFVNVSELYGLGQLSTEDIENELEFLSRRGVILWKKR